MLLAGAPWTLPGLFFTVGSALWVSLLITAHPGSRRSLEGTSFPASLGSSAAALLRATALVRLVPRGVLVQQSFSAGHLSSLLATPKASPHT